MELAVSILQIADFGLKVSSVVYQYSQNVRRADSRIKLLGNHVKYTSNVIDELGRLFAREQTHNIISPKAEGTAKELARDCSSLFEEIQTALDDGKKNHWKWPFKQPDVDLHMA